MERQQKPSVLEDGEVHGDHCELAVGEDWGKNRQNGAEHRRAGCMLGGRRGWHLVQVTCTGYVTQSAPPPRM